MGVGVSIVFHRGLIWIWFEWVYLPERERGGYVVFHRHLLTNVVLTEILFSGNKVGEGGVGETCSVFWRPADKMCGLRLFCWKFRYQMCKRCPFLPVQCMWARFVVVAMSVLLSFLVLIIPESLEQSMVQAHVVQSIPYGMGWILIRQQPFSGHISFRKQ